MAKAHDLKGKRFHSLVVVDRCNIKSPSGKVQWVCECDCGACLNVVTQNLINGNTKTCGCGKVERARQQGLKNRKHGLTKTIEYKTWVNMKGRCLNPKYENYPNYGGRGIRVCNRWLNSFELFLKDMGPRPSPAHSIDRKDPDGDYEPDNCRWATIEEQCNNKRASKKYLLDGESFSVAQLSRKFNIPYSTLECRLIRDALPLEKALTKQASNHEFTYGGKTRRLNEWCVELGLKYSTVYRRIFTNGLSFEEAILPKDLRRK